MSPAGKSTRREPLVLAQDVPGTNLQVVAILGTEGLPGARPAAGKPPRNRALGPKDRNRYLVAQVLHPNFVCYYDVATHTYRTNAPGQATLFRRPSIATAVQVALGAKDHAVLKCTVDAQGRLQPESIVFKGWRRSRDSTPGLESWEETKKPRRGRP